MNINSLLDNDTQLPPSPQILPKLQSLLKDPNVSVHEIIKLVKVDASLTAQIIRNSNSAYLAMRVPCNNLEEAIVRIGLNQTYRVVTTAVAKQLLQDALPVYRIGRAGLLKSAICSALFLTTVGQRTMLMDPDTAYTVGILHGLGKVVINQYFLKRNVEIYGDTEGPVTFMTERKLLGFDNAQVAAGLLKKWKFTDDIHDPIRYQFVPSEAAGKEAPAALLAISTLTTPYVFERGIADQPPVYVDDPQLLRYAGIEEEDFIMGVSHVRTVIKEYDYLFKD